ncbi:DNA repair protein RecN [Schleiferilactobacillus harbinensis]|jgi:DNA repair protein RecN (Recombination protein N)|uniref:DNA repair protein RecN n=1 Tax=Schleiferilactobacillus harbinensis TaxID=304207 RepID=A0A510TUF8_9LACO|nr:DNA repair protein RecN [Schleiferilactobacillus harbinensis]QFR23835.1 DNA repair protein RecN [Schleiferilactobacillus harbinensis]GEK05927.1 DNA repair protein RecN [Schleiferilactobacillus harbinensis]HAY52789.1 DNA repair protein RecN [Lactobacillus sp.]
MLQELAIHDFAIIEQLSVDFSTGMTVLTGETGAGKSIIIDAVGILVGGRGSADFIRTGTKKATVEGMFSIPAGALTQNLLQHYGVGSDDDQDTVVLQRELFTSGRNVCRINGHLVNTSTLKAVGETLVDIHGQNEHQELMHPEKHLSLLDQYAADQIKPLLAAYQQRYADWKDLAGRVKERVANEREWAQRLDMLQYQAKEINDAHLQPTEEDDLTSERDRLNHFQQIQDALQTGYGVLNGDDDEAGVIDRLAEAMAALQNIAHLDADYENMAESLGNAYYALQDVGSDLSHQMDGLEYDPARLEQVEDRLATITQLEHKYGATVPDVIAFGQKVNDELDEMNDTQGSSDELKVKLAKAQTEALAAAKKLSATRVAAAKQLSKDIHQQLADLYMAKAVFDVHFTVHEDQLGPTGIDSVEFYIQTNPGEKLRPLARTASGGELSRIMLALKTIFSQADGVTSIIFDEVDTGVSGRVAQAIAEKISRISRHSQVLCITHLPQVAAMADHQVHIAKTVKSGRTMTRLTPLTGTGRVEELARMLAGTTITKLTKEHAQELLRLAIQDKNAQAKEQTA